jgi:organic radical activating enzyme
VFGPTWQGEGPHAGRIVGFVRLGLCNLSCSWCDTPYTWDRSRFDLAVECPPTPIAEIHSRLAALPVTTVVLSGGEPLIHHRLLLPLLVPPWTWHAETNGTIPPPDWWTERVEHTSVSPKVITDDPEHRRIRLPALHEWARLTRFHLPSAPSPVSFKFVAQVPADLDAIAHLAHDLLDLAPSSVWVMPQGRTTPEILTCHRDLAEGILERGWSTTTRLHVLLFGDTRGT